MITKICLHLIDHTELQNFLIAPRTWEITEIYDPMQCCGCCFVAGLILIGLGLWTPVLLWECWGWVLIASSDKILLQIIVRHWKMYILCYILRLKYSVHLQSFCYQISVIKNYQFFQVRYFVCRGSFVDYRLPVFHCIANFVETYLDFVVTSAHFSPWPSRTADSHSKFDILKLLKNLAKW